MVRMRTFPVVTSEKDCTYVRENNDIMMIFTFYTTLNKSFGKKSQSVLEKEIRVSGFSL